MPDQENQPPEQNPIQPEEPVVPNTRTPDTPSPGTPTGAPNKPGGCFGFGLGCIGGIFYLAFIIGGTVGIAKALYMKRLLFDVLAVCGPLPILYYAKKNNNLELFWGFLIPYVLVLLIFGQCVFPF